MDLGSVEENIKGDTIERGKILYGILEHTAAWNDVDSGSGMRMKMDLSTVEETIRGNIAEKGKKITSRDTGTHQRARTTRISALE